MTKLEKKIIEKKREKRILSQNKKRKKRTLTHTGKKEN